MKPFYVSQTMWCAFLAFLMVIAHAIWKDALDPYARWFIGAMLAGIIHGNRTDDTLVKLGKAAPLLLLCLLPMFAVGCAVNGPTTQPVSDIQNRLNLERAALTSAETLWVVIGEPSATPAQRQSVAVAFTVAEAAWKTAQADVTQGNSSQADLDAMVAALQAYIQATAIPATTIAK